MALIKCDDCGKKISDIHSSCPHCGDNGNLTVKRQAPFSKVIFILFNIGLVVWLIWVSGPKIDAIAIFMALIIWAIGFLVFRYFKSIEISMDS